MEMGKFVGVYGEAIFETKPWIHQNDTESIWYTSKLRSDHHTNSQRVYNAQDENNTIIYAFILDWNVQAQVELTSVKPTDRVTRQAFQSLRSFMFRQRLVSLEQVSV